MTPQDFQTRGDPAVRLPQNRIRSAFPAFLSQGRPGPAFRGLSHPLHHLQPKISAEPELKRKQGLQMWQRAIDKGDKISSALPIRLKDMKQTCNAVPFTQRVTAPGCDAVTVHNNLCFGQCSSLFVPPEGEFGLGAHRRSPCSRCAPSKVHTVTVPLKCGSAIRSKKVMVVEECRCETGREENTATAQS
ncbi:DAN domain family member 5 [Neosynchiropus ocellatus]